MAAAVISAAPAKATEMAIAETTDRERAQQSVRRAAVEAGFDGNGSEEIALVVAELAANLIKHAGRGVLRVRTLEQGGHAGIEIEAEDHGPGIADVEQSFADGYSTKGSLGYGLGTVNRLMDEIDVRSMPGCGTYIVCRRWVRRRAETGTVREWDIGVMTRARRNASENGDAFVVRTRERDLLIGLIDGLGHGEHAQTAALAAQRYVEKHADSPLEKIFLGASRACRATRGVVMALAHFSSATHMNFASVGNVEARVCGSAERIPLLARRGIVGTRDLQAPVQAVLWDPNWVLVLHTDGLRTHWQWSDFPGLEREPAKVIASRLMRALAKDDDDATVVVARREIP
jgi:anti-sigma regulatory factor (Ser/Thr protein kinase)